MKAALTTLAITQLHVETHVDRLPLPALPTCRALRARPHQQQRAAQHATQQQQTQRGAARHHAAGARFEKLPPADLTGWRAGGAIALCGLPVLFGFLIPVVVLAEMATRSEQDLLSPRYLMFINNSLTLAGIAAVLTVFGAILIGFGQRLVPGKLSNAAANIARIGYAVPGGVIAVGLIVPFAAFDNALDAFMRETFGIRTGLLITGSIWLLIIAYMVRFMAAALGAYDGGQATIHNNMDAVARTLGHGPASMLRRVHLPILRPSVLTAGLIVFVDVMKELPATMIPRPLHAGSRWDGLHRPSWGRFRSTPN